MTARNHPLGTTGLVFSACSLVPLPVLGGVVGSLLGAIGGFAARRSGGRYGSTTADVAVGLGLVLGSIPLLALSLARADDWTWIPFGLAVGHAAIVCGLLAAGRASGPGAVGGAVAGSMGVLAAAGVAIAGVLALTAFFVFLGELLWDIVTGGG